MHSLNNRGVHSENLRIFPNCAPNKMDYRQKMVVPNSEQLKHEEDEDEDLEALRLAALKSLRAKNTLRNVRQPVVQPQPAKPRAASYQSCPVYGHQRTAKRGGYYQNRLPRQNGNFYYQSRVNQNLIEIVPVEEDNVVQKDRAQNEAKTEKSDDTGENRDTEGDSKFYRYTDNASGSEEEDTTKELNSASTAPLTSKSDRLEKSEFEGDGSGTEKDVQSGFDDSPREEIAGDKVATSEEVNEDEVEEEEEEEQDDEEEEEEGEEEEEEEEEEEDEKAANDDDDDILLMADLEEEDSLERLMDEMEREMNVDKLPEKKEKKPTRRDTTKESPKSADTEKARNRKSSRAERRSDKNGVSGEKVSVSSSSSIATKSANDLRSISPRPANRAQQQQQQKRRSLSPKPRLRKKSPRRSPRRSPPPRPAKKLSREMPRTRSPRKLSPPARLSPRPRSPQNPATSPPSWSPFGTSPLRKLSPRGRSPRSRSPRGRRSRSPRAILAPRSPRPRKSRSPRALRSPPKRSNRSPRSPRIGRSRSPRVSPSRQSPRGRSPFRGRSPIRARSPPRSKSPRGSPHRLSPLRRSSPRRGGLSPRARSPKFSPERRRASPVRLRSPVRHSPHRSPWPSPRNSPRLSPRRRARSPKESTRKVRPRSVTPEEKSSAGYKRECPSPEPTTRSKVKQTSTKESSGGGGGGGGDATNDPVLEARRRKFESTKLIDPINDNKKIKLSKKETTSKKMEAPEEREPPVESPKSREIVDDDDDYDIEESDLCLTDDYVYGVLEDVASDASSANEAVAMCVEMVPVKAEKVRSKKKKKRDKELYQVGKLKTELPLSERIGKEKKCKKRKDRNSSPVESSPEPAATAATAATATVVEDLTVDEEGDLRTELSRRRAERLNRAAPIQSARLLQSAFKGVVKEVAKTNAKGIQRHAPKGDEKNNKKEERRVTVLHRQVADLPDSEEEAAVVDSKVPVRFRLGLNKPAAQESREPKAARKSSKRAGRKVKHKNNMSLTDHERKKQ